LSKELIVKKKKKKRNLVHIASFFISKVDPYPYKLVFGRLIVSYELSLRKKKGRKSLTVSSEGVTIQWKLKPNHCISL